MLLLKLFDAAKWDGILTIEAECQAPAVDCPICVYRHDCSRLGPLRPCIYAMADGAPEADWLTCASCKPLAQTITEMPCRAVPPAVVVDMAIDKLEALGVFDGG